MNSKTTIGLLVIVLAFWWPSLKDFWNTPIEPDQPTPVVADLINIDFEPVEEPSEEMQGIVISIPEVIVGDDAKWDRVRIAQYYAQLSKIVKYEPNFIESTEQFRTFYSTSGQINFAGQSLKDKYSGLGEAVDAAIVKAIGKENKKLDKDTRQKLSEILAAISWILFH